MPSSNGSFWQKVAYGIGGVLLSMLVYEIRQTRIDLVAELAGVRAEVGKMKTEVATWSVSILNVERRITNVEDKINRGILPIADERLRRLDILHPEDQPHSSGGR